MEDVLLVEGMLVGGDSERIEIVVTPFLFSFDRAGLLAVESLPDPPLLVPGAARAVRLRLRVGIRLFGLRPSAEQEATMWRTRSSFAVATRRAAVPEQTPQTEEQRTATREFLRKHGIDAEDLDSV